jgi:hypothetical protein
MAEPTVKAALTALIKIEELTNVQASQGRARTEPGGAGGLKLVVGGFCPLTLDDMRQRCAHYKIPVDGPAMASPGTDADSDEDDSELQY